PAPAAIRRNVVLHRAHRGDLRAVADLEVVVDTDLCSQGYVVTDRQAAREPDLGRQQAMPANGHIVTDLDLIVDFGALADHGIAQAAAIDRGSGPDLDVILDQHPAGLRNLQVPVGPEKDETIAVLPDAAAGMDQHIVADQRALDDRTRADIAVAADLDAGADHAAGADYRAGADLDVSPDQGHGIDDHAVLEPRRGIDDGRRRDAVMAEPGGWPERIAMPLARKL